MNPNHCRSSGTRATSSSSSLNRQARRLPAGRTWQRGARGHIKGLLLIIKVTAGHGATVGGKRHAHDTNIRACGNDSRVTWRIRQIAREINALA